MSDFSVEIGHIYQDMELNEFYAKTLDDSFKLVEKHQLTSFTTKLLIDDLNIGHKAWEVDELVSFINEQNINIDFLFLESKFSHIADDFISKLPEEFIKKERFRKDKKNNLYFVNDNFKIKLKEIHDCGKEHYSCPLLSTLWQLCRLGIYEYPKNSFISLNKEKSIHSETTLTIIDKKYENIEKMVLHLLSYVVNTNKIKHVFF